MKLARDLKITQKTAWFMLHRLREAWDASGIEPFEGPVEVDETYFGGLRRNMPKAKRESLTGRGVAGKAVVIGVKDRATNRVRARVIRNTDALTLKRFVLNNIDYGAKIYTDEASAYEGLPGHRAVKHSAGEYVKEMAHTNGIESFWSTLKRAHKGTFHKLSPKHLNRYIREFSGKHNRRPLDTIDQDAVGDCRADRESSHVSGVDSRQRPGLHGAVLTPGNFRFKHHQGFLCRFVGTLPFTLLVPDLSKDAPLALVRVDVPRDFRLLPWRHSKDLVLNRLALSIAATPFDQLRPQ